MYRTAFLILPLAFLPAALPSRAERSGAPIEFEHAFERVADLIRPGVVTITSSRRVRPAETYGPEQLLGLSLRHEELESFFQQYGSEDMPLKEYGMGSGVVLAADGYILTNNHVVANAGELKVHLPDKRTFSARVVGSDPQTDLAVVKIEATNLTPVKFGDSKTVKVGQWVAAFGSPFGLDQTMSSGIVSAKSRASLHIVDDEDYLQTDAAINPGNSGGPLVDLDGQVVGINAAIVSRTGGYQGVGLAIPAHMAREIANKLMKDGKVVRGWLGVAVQELTPDLATSFGCKNENGVLVAEVQDNSPAKRSGLVAGDIVVTIDGKSCEGLTQFRHAIADIRPGTKTMLGVWREGRTVELQAEIANQPRSIASAVVDAAAKMAFGLELADANTLKPGAYRLPEGTQGVVVTRVAPDSCADSCGLEPGDILVRIERTDVVDATQARELLRTRTNQGAALLVTRRGTPRWIHLEAVEAK